ncbi:MAG: DUF1294 domain-containing protein [Planctomycetota bacterium]
MRIDALGPAAGSLVAALAAANLACAALYGWDKARAARGRRRVAERTLLWTSLPGTAPGAWCAVFLFRHKNRKAGYLVRLALVTLVQLAALYWILTLR